ncbi:MAG: rhodanese-like domain-containing protein [Gemmatimonadaceae bacterium]
MSRLPAMLDPGALATARQRTTRIRLLDVRTPAEFAGGHLEGSYNVPLDRLRAHAAELRAIDAPIVLVCRSGVRARSAEAVLGEAGVRDLHVLDGGVLAWRAAGQPVIRAAGSSSALVRRLVGVAAVVAAVAIGRTQPITALLLGLIGLRLALGLPLLPCAVAGACGGGGDDTAATVRAGVADIPPGGPPTGEQPSGEQPSGGQPSGGRPPRPAA